MQPFRPATRPRPRHVFPEFPDDPEIPDVFWRSIDSYVPIYGGRLKEYPPSHFLNGVRQATKVVPLNKDQVFNPPVAEIPAFLRAEGTRVTVVGLQ